MICRKTFLLCVLSVFIAATAQATFIDLTPPNFFKDPTVTIIANGFGAIIAEKDSLVNPVLLSNDPGLGEPELIRAGTNLSLVFQFSFDEGGGSDDEFGAFIIDKNGPTSDSALQFFTQGDSSGTISFDLSRPTIDPFDGDRCIHDSVFMRVREILLT